MKKNTKLILGTIGALTSIVVFAVLLFTYYDGQILRKNEEKNSHSLSSSVGSSQKNTNSTSNDSSTNIDNSNSISNSNTQSNTQTNTNTSTNTNTNKNTNSSSNKNTSTNSNKKTNSNKPTNSNSNVTKPLTVAETVDRKLKEMTLDEKIGQMLIISVTGTSLNSTTKNNLTKYKPGGVILFANNLADYNTTIQFVDNMKKTSSIPLIVSIDQEGGKVQRLTSITGKLATNIPPMFSLGKMDDTNLSYSVGTVIAEELRVFGFNMDFAPVLDVLSSEDSKVIGTRSFGTDPNLVSKMGISLAKGLESKGVIAVYKHFPGHGATETDSHYDLPVLSKTKAELYDKDFIPFQKAIQNDAKVIMIGHLAVPNITGDKTPASLSKVLITDILKKEMGYKGLVITDALNMGALSKNYTEKQIYEMAINAGVDILLMPKSPESAIKYIKQSIKEGKIKESQINESVRKILMLKYKKKKTDKLSTSYLGSKAHKDIINKVNQ